MQENNAAFVAYQVFNQIGTILFFTPQHNSLPATMLAQLANTIEAAGKDVNSKVLILKSGGTKTFCAGASFNELLQIQTEAEGLAFFSGFAKVINAMRVCPKFILGRIQGKAIGGGLGLASACDYSFATADAAIKLSELEMGIGPFVVGPAVERKLGTTAAYELAIDASNFRSAEWAKQKGLYTATYENIELMDEAIETLAIKLALSSADAMKEIKAIFWKGTDNWDELLVARAAISGRLILSDESKNFMKAFKKI